MRKPSQQRAKSRPEPSPSPRPRRTKWIVGILAGLLIAGGGVGISWWNARVSPGSPPPPVNEPAPRFNLFASTGRVITLDEYLGKQEVVLLFYMSAG